MRTSKKSWGEWMIQFIGILIAILGLTYNGVKDYQKGDIKFPKMTHQVPLTKPIFPIQYCLMGYDPNLDRVFYLHENGIWYDYAPQIASGQIKVEDSINTSSLLEKLIQGKVDTVYISEFIGNCKLKKRPDSGAFYDSALPHSSSHYFLSTIKYPKLLVSFNKFLKDKKSDIDAMTKDYIDNKCK